MRSKCQSCEEAQFRFETHKDLRQYTGEHVYCKIIKLEVFGYIDECSDHKERK